MFYDGYHFWGMHLIWWFVWILLLFLLFSWYAPVPRKKIKRDSAIEVLQKRFAAGHITNEEYQEKKKILEADFAKYSKETNDNSNKAS